MSHKAEIHLTCHGQGTVKLDGHDIMVRSLSFTASVDEVNELVLVVPCNEIILTADACTARQVGTLKPETLGGDNVPPEDAEWDDNMPPLETEL